MVFYKIEAKREMPEGENELSSREKRGICSCLAERSENFFYKSSGQCFIATVLIRDDSAVFTVISKSHDTVKAQFEKYIKEPIFQITSFKIEETTFASLESLLLCAQRNSYIIDDDEILERFELDRLQPHRGSYEFGEAIIDDSLTINDCKMIASKLLFENTMHPELDRIQKSSVVKNSGHPVHYILRADNRDIRNTIYKSLLSALYAKGRIKNKRYSFVDYDSESRFPDATFEALYRSSAGGAVVIRYIDSDNDDNQFSKRGTDIIATICDIAVKYKNSVLTIICLPKTANKVKEDFLLNFGSTAFIEIYEDVAFGAVAENYLKVKAKENKVRTDKKLTSLIEAGKGYTATELNHIFDDWYSKKLRNEIYPEYKMTKTAKIKIRQEEPRGTAYEKLDKLIGLDSAKEVMNNALNYFKAQKLFADRGMIAERPSMHMIFTGNPGTAKTTVARLFAQIMKENGLLTNGDIYEVGRADIVGKYVGSTAPLVKSAFKRAKGGVLFIDEAYSLVDDRDGLFGDEAINTIVQEMENNRKDTIVIFAGYPDKMEGFLNKNPGLRSRIAFNIHFDDYNSQELCDIAELIAAEKKFVLSSDAKEKLKNVFDKAQRQNDFGNGRFARNIIEKAKMAQANRLMKADVDNISNEELITITAEDIEILQDKPEIKKIQIGFTA
ncbi:MAG: AAA family ATPase [Clostridia bacterium]|nr:AAA family ATPase [Clostridia bacterium]